MDDIDIEACFRYGWHSGASYGSHGGWNMNHPSERSGQTFRLLFELTR